MKTTVRNKILKSGMLVLSFLLVTAAFAQGSAAHKDDKNDDGTPALELVFANAVLESGTDKADGAVYYFANVAAGTDARIKISRRSHASVVVAELDVTGSGWNKAFQPQVGIPGGIPANTSIWMEFEVSFFEAGNNKKKKVDKFVATALDVDGNGQSVKEFIQFDKASSVKYAPVSYLSQATALPSGTYTDDADNATGTDILSQGPVDNFVNIDTSATQVMATYTYLKKDKFTFRVGARNGSGNAAGRVIAEMTSARTGGTEDVSGNSATLMSTDPNLRLNSIWFKTFTMAPMVSLPVTTTSFTATYNKKDVLLNWTTQSEINFSHFVVERSTDGRQFSEIALVFTDNGTDGAKGYNFKDVSIATATGALYYRLRQVDKTGDVTYSNTRIIKLGRNEMESMAISTFPNPVTDLLKVSLPNAWQGKPVVLALYNSTGLLVQNVKVNSAGQTETLQMNSLAKGFYLVKGSCENSTAGQRVIKN